MVTTQGPLPRSMGQKAQKLQKHDHSACSFKSHWMKIVIRNHPGALMVGVILSSHGYKASTSTYRHMKTWELCLSCSGGG
jgi:hypothetical protein